jgi:hypothetical protein
MSKIKMGFLTVQPGTHDEMRIRAQQSYLVSLRAFLALNDVEFDWLTVLQRLVAVDLDRAVVDENIFVTIAPDKPKPFALLNQRTTPMNCAIPSPLTRQQGAIRDFLGALTKVCKWVYRVSGF